MRQMKARRKGGIVRDEGIEKVWSEGGLKGQG